MRENVNARMCVFGGLAGGTNDRNKSAGREIGRLRETVDMATSATVPLAIFLVFLGCTSNVVFLEMIVK